MISRNFTLGLVVALGIGAYPMLAALMSLVGAGESRLPSILLRLGVVFVALAATFLNRKSLRAYHPVFLGCYAVFWLLYLFRVIDNAYMTQIPLGADPVEVLAMIGIFVLLPTLPAFAGLNPWSNKWGFRLLTAITAATVALLLLQLGELAALAQAAGDIRFRVDRLNPISVGYVGATMVMLAVVGVCRPNPMPDILKRGFFLVAGGAGVFLVVLSASRGPAIATIFGLLCYGFIPFRINRAIMTMILGAAVAAGVFVMAKFVQRVFEFDMVKRILEASDGYDESALSREESYAGAWQQFIDNPFLGDAIVVKATEGYPHNLVLEALMATGVFGGLAYIVMLLVMLAAAVRLLNRQDGYEWIALLGIVFGVSGMFSGTHYTADIQWLTLVLVAITEIKLRASSKVHRARQQRETATREAAAEAFAPPRSLAEKELMKGTARD